MVLKTVIVLLIIETAYTSCSDQEKFIIENKKTGLVWQRSNEEYELAEWANSNSQLWTLEPQKKIGYFKIRNVATGHRIACRHNGVLYNIFKFNIHGYTRIELEEPKRLQVQDGNSLLCSLSKRNDDSDKWLFITQSNKLNMKFVIENKKSGMVWEEAEDDKYQLSEWVNADSQLWNMEPQGKAGYYKIRNVGSGGYIGCTDDDAFYDIWKLDIHGYTRINLEKPELFEIQENNLFLCDKYKRNDGRDKWLVVEHSKKLNMKYIIENKQTGAVLEQGVNNNYLAEWDNTDSQLWILEPQNRGGYFKIRNAESGRNISCFSDGVSYERWKLNLHDDTRIETVEPKLFQVQKNNLMVCSKSKRNDGSDKWLIVEQSKKVKMKYVIENEQTGMVWDKKEKGLFEIAHWDNTDSQLWTLEPQGKGGYYNIRNVASGLTVLCACNNQSCETIKINIHGDKRLVLEQPNLRENNLFDCSPFKYYDNSNKWSLVEQSEKVGMKFVIENKKTGMVLEEADTIQMGEWEDNDSQLWLLKPQTESGYSIVNIASGNPLTYFKNDENYRAWQLNTRRYTWISIEDLNIFLAHKGGKAKFVKRKQKDDSDRWLLVDETSKRYKAKFKTVNSDKCQKKFVIKNKETERILDVPQKFLELNERDERISQLWTLEPQHKFGSFIIRNGANKGLLTYLSNGTEYQTWNLETIGDTRIKVADFDVLLVDREGEADFIEHIESDEYIEDTKSNESDIWVLIEQECENDVEPKSIYIETQVNEK